MYGALPPEINSGRMYAGPGAGSMLAAAAAWDGLAMDLNSTAISYESVITGLISGRWLGATATTMAAATVPYVTWLHATAAQAEEAAGQAKAAVAAYEAAFAMTVPPALIAANRIQLAVLVATNFLGQNASAIAATEAQYGEMWAADAAAMYSYAATSAAASTLPPFAPPPQTANPAGQAAQAAAVANVTGTSATSDLVTTLHQLTGALPSVLGGLSAGYPGIPRWVVDLNTVLNTVGPPFFATTSSGSLMLSMLSTLKTLVPAASTIGSQAATSMGSVATGAFGSGVFDSAVSAGLGQGVSIGRLSVPQAWGATVPPLTRVATAMPGAAMGGAASFDGNVPSLLGGLPAMASGARIGVTNSSPAQDGITPLRVLPQLV
jgi:PPE-repeat protein